MPAIRTRLVITGVAIVVAFGAASPVTATAASAHTAMVCHETHGAKLLRKALRPVLKAEVVGYQRSARTNAVQVAHTKGVLANVLADSASTASDTGIATADVAATTTLTRVIAAAKKKAVADRTKIARCGAKVMRTLIKRAMRRQLGFGLDTAVTTRTQWAAHLEWDRVTRDSYNGVDQDEYMTWSETVASDQSVVGALDDDIAALQKQLK
jgi:hypothetical protein